jgi:hypothetical protein
MPVNALAACLNRELADATSPGRSLYGASMRGRFHRSEQKFFNDFIR